MRGHPRRPIVRRYRWAGALLAIVVGLLPVAPGPAVAQQGTTCERNASGVTMVRLGEGGKTTLAVRNGKLFVNGRFCERAEHVFIQDEGNVSSDHVVLKIGRGWFRSDGDLMTVGANMRGWPDEGSPDRLDIHGTGLREKVTINSSSVAVSRGNARVVFGMNVSGFGDIRIALRGGNDRLVMGTTNSLYTYRGALSVNGGPGNDRLTGTGPVESTQATGAETLIGGPGDDRLVGRGGDDTLIGGPGADTIIGGGGVDVARGGPGDDRFEMVDATIDTVIGAAGNDRCTCDPEDTTSGI